MSFFRGEDNSQFTCVFIVFYKIQGAGDRVYGSFEADGIIRADDNCRISFLICFAGFDAHDYIIVTIRRIVDAFCFCPATEIIADSFRGSQCFCGILQISLIGCNLLVYFRGKVFFLFRTSCKYQRRTDEGK